MHADVGNAKILLEGVVGSLDKASRRTVHEVRKEWIDEKLKEIKDPTARTLFVFYDSHRVDLVAMAREGRQVVSGLEVPDLESFIYRGGEDSTIEDGYGTDLLAMSLDRPQSLARFEIPNPERFVHR